MKSTKSYLVIAFVIAFSVLLVVPLWGVYGALTPEEGGHGGEMVMAMKFRKDTMAFIDKYKQADGWVEPPPGATVPILASQYFFMPDKIRLETGENYHFQVLSADVVHSFSLQMGGSSYNAVIMPMMITAIEMVPTQPGTYLVNCNEYCGIGHDFMTATFEVVGEPVAPGTLPEEHEE